MTGRHATYGLEASPAGEVAKWAKQCLLTLTAKTRHNTTLRQDIVLVPF